MLNKYFWGGIRLSARKEASADKAIHAVPLPGRLVIPLRQSAGNAPHPIVKTGDKVKKGQKIASAEGWISASLHAPTSGTVTAIGDYPVAHPSGLSAPCIVIDADGEDAWTARQPLLTRNSQDADFAPEAVQRFLREMGIVGMGGAVFPSHVKLDKANGVLLETLIVNGAECEPFITCDDRLMQEHADDIVSGLVFLSDVLTAKESIIAIENNKPMAIRAMQAALAARVETLSHNIRLAVIPAVYPAGSVKQLVYALTGKRAPAHVITTALGVQCFNVATVHAVWRAVAHGEPVIHRVVTLTGDLDHPGNLAVPIGMSIRELLTHAGLRPASDGVLVGGPMMGFLLPSLDAGIAKGVNCLIARAPALFPAMPPESPCIRCTSCAAVCPQGLQPYEMYWWSRAREFKKVEKYRIAECIECGCCAYVCPAAIPLVQYFRFAKGELRAAAREQEMADAARARFEFRQFRAEREKAERAEKLAQAAARQAALRHQAESASKDLTGGETPPGFPATQANASPSPDKNEISPT